MITKDWTLPELITKYPGTRRVFDEAGLHGCGGASGPHETVEFFARVHGVPLDKLLGDLEAAKDETPAAYREDLGDVLYRRFFRAAIVVILTAGATLGAAMLALYGFRRTFTSADLVAPIQAHANAQLFGWVGLFVMGFAVQGLPRFKYVHLWRPGLANLSFVFMLAGLALRMGAAWTWSGARAIGLAGSLLETASVALFTVVILATLRTSRTRDVWDKYVLVSLACFAAFAALEPVLFWSPRPEFMGRYRDLQLLGFAGFMILGVGQRILPTAFGFRDPGKRLADVAFVLLLLGLAVDLAGWGGAGSVLYALGALALADGLGGFTRGDGGRSTKFIRAAFFWLAVACAMILVEPFLRPSHAYHGAIRHAFTVGFISLMILGVSSKVVPILGGIEAGGLPSLWIPFVLVNAGNTLRVVFQVLTDVAPGPAYPVMGASGALEVAGLGIWGVHLWTLLGRPSGGAPAVASPPERITADLRVAQIADWWPETLEVFDRFGFKELKNPVLRATIARRVTVRMACELKHVSETEFLAALNGARRVH